MPATPMTYATALLAAARIVEGGQTLTISGRTEHDGNIIGGPIHVPAGATLLLRSVNGRFWWDPSGHDPGDED